jgi:hypothetical protein
MEWANHRRWARKFGIQDTVADYVNIIIDVSDENRFPDGYLQNIKRCASDIAAERGSESGNSGLSLVIVEQVKKHDAGRRQTTRGALAAECILRYLEQKGEEYLMAWYLHHHLDYLHGQQSAESDLQNLISGYENKYPSAHSPVIEQFLLDNRAALADELAE